MTCVSECACVYVYKNHNNKFNAYGACDIDKKKIKIIFLLLYIIQGSQGPAQASVQEVHWIFSGRLLNRYRVYIPVVARRHVRYAFVYVCNIIIIIISCCVRRTRASIDFFFFIYLFLILLPGHDESRPAAGGCTAYKHYDSRENTGYTLINTRTHTYILYTLVNMYVDVMRISSTRTGNATMWICIHFKFKQSACIVM